MKRYMARAEGRSAVRFLRVITVSGEILSKTKF